MKTTKFLSILALMTITALSANADATGTQELNATLAPYVDITPTTPKLNVNIVPSTGNLENPFISVFNIRANDSLKLELKATTIDATSTPRNAFFETASGVYVVLSNLNHAPTALAVDNIMGGTPDKASNANAIAYRVSDIEISGQGATDPNYEDDKKRFTFEVNPGDTTATTTISQAAMEETYDFNDQAGVYQAIVTMTSTST